MRRAFSFQGDETMNAYEVTLNVNDHEVTMPIEANTSDDAATLAVETLDQSIGRLLKEVKAIGRIPMNIQPVRVEAGERQYRATCNAVIEFEFWAPGDISPEDVEDQLMADFDLGNLSKTVDIEFTRRGSDSDEDRVSVQTRCDVREEDTYDAPYWKFEEIK
jgi:hypothetical protein